MSEQATCPSVRLMGTWLLNINSDEESSQVWDQVM
jgi:hypothetical protein